MKPARTKSGLEDQVRTLTAQVEVLNAEKKIDSSLHVDLNGNSLDEIVAAIMGQPVALKTLAQASGLHPSTAHRILGALVNDRLVERADPGSYRLGIRLLELGNLVKARINVREHALPHMRDLHAATGEAVNLSVRRDDEIVYVERTSTGRSLMQVVNIVGTRAPLHITAAGKLFLLEDGSEGLRGYAQRTRLPQLTRNTLTTVGALEKEIDRIRRNGYALDNEEAELGVRCIEHATFVTPQTAALMANNGTYAVPTLAVVHALNADGARFGLPEASQAKLAGCWEAMLRGLSILKQAGVKMGFGTDLLAQHQDRQCIEFEIRADVLPNDVSHDAPSVLRWEKGGEIMQLPLRDAREVFEREYLLAQVTRFGGNISRTATFVGMERSALHRKLKSLGLHGGAEERSAGEAAGA